MKIKCSFQDETNFLLRIFYVKISSSIIPVISVKNKVKSF